MDPSPPPQDRLTRTLEREVIRRKRLTAALILASCAATALSVVTLRERQQLRRSTAELDSCDRACREAAPTVPAAGFFVPARALPAPQPVPDLLGTPLEVLCPDGDIRSTTLDAATVPGAVHLANLWQLSCPGCLREFPLLARALERTRGVRFLPIDDPGIHVPAVDYRTAQSRHGMPPPSLSLIDRGPDGARMLPATAPWVEGNPVVYPFTFVLDCEKKLRWWKLGALAEPEADALAALLVDLQRADSCRPDAPPATVCRERRPVLGRRDPIKRERLTETTSPPTDESPPPLLESTPAGQPDESTQPAAPPASNPTTDPPSEPPAPAPKPEPPRSYPSREACQLECRAERHTCQIAAQGHYRCAPPPDTN